MRKSSQVVMGVISLATVVTGFEVGANAKSNSFTAGPTTPTDTGTPTSNPTGSTTHTPTKSPTGSPTTTKTPTTNPTPTDTQPPSDSVTKTSDPIYYRYGTVQLSVTKTGSKITDISMIQAGATQGRGGAFPYLIQLALDAQSGNFDTSMMSGATFTTDAFMQALDSALSQF